MQRVLIVDDDVHVCETLRRVLDHAGLSHRISLSAESATTAAAEFMPNAAIIDFVLPDTDGITLAQKLKRDCPEVRIVMISGVPEFEATLGAEARRAGVSVFVEKPFRAAEILDALKA